MTAGITLAELADMPLLGITVESGREALTRRVFWSHVSELNDPCPWLEGGELLCSVGYWFPKDPDAQVQYLTRLAERGVAGFAISESARPKLSAKLMAAGNALPMPIFLVKIEVSYAEIIRTIASASEERSQRRLLTHVQIFDSLQAELSGDITTPELLERLGRLTGYSISLAGLDGRPLLDDVPTPAGDPISSLPHLLDRTMSIDDSYVIPVRVKGETLGYVVAVEKPNAQLAGRVALQHVETIVALALERQRTREQAAELYRARLLEDMIASDLRPAAAGRALENEGFDLSTELLLARVSSQSGATLDDVAAERLTRRLRRQGEPCMLGHKSGSLLARSSPEVIDVLAEHEDLVAGISRPFAFSSGFELARREATLALQTARSAKLKMARSGTDVSHPMGLPADRTSLEQLVSSVLGSLIDYDSSHQSELVPSLRCYLQHDRRLQAAAKSMFVHPNSLSYRLRRIDEITGRRLATVATQTEYWLALEAQRLLTIDG